MLAWLAILTLAGPAATGECSGLTRHFDLCDAGTDWATGEWEQFGDGATLHLGPIALDSVEDWAGRHKGEAPDVGAALEAIVTDRIAGTLQVDHLRDMIETPHMNAARVIQTITFPGDAPILRASMVAEGGGHRVLVMLSAPATVPLAEIDRRSAEVATLVRPVTKDQP